MPGNNSSRAPKGTYRNKACSIRQFLFYYLQTVRTPRLFWHPSPIGTTILIDRFICLDGNRIIPCQPPLRHHAGYGELGVDSHGRLSLSRRAPNTLMPRCLLVSESRLISVYKTQARVGNAQTCYH